MKLNTIFKVLITILFVAMIVVLSIPIGQLPVIGHFLNPFTGFVQNAYIENETDDLKINLSQLNDHAEVHYDTSGVPHIFAENDDDLYFLQGYIVAKDRLWQMDMQGRSGMGELSEIVGEKALENDRLMRRLGLADAANELLNQSKKDGSYATILKYTEGVNAYINSLSPSEYPLEYKLMNFKPRAFKPEYTAVLLKIMALRLTAMEADIENTNFVNKFGKEDFDRLFPSFYKEEAPIIPKGTLFNKTTSNDSVSLNTISSKLYAKRVLKELDRNLGSNNWAVNSSKSSTNNAILCNDPHLKIHLPSVWYEMHLVSKNQNVYGVTMPGAPGIVIGFNKNIAWGVTNAGRDVRNWYDIQFKDATRNQILVDSTFETVKMKLESIYVKGRGWVQDTILTTSFGRIVYDRNFNIGDNALNLALSWTNYIRSNEMLTFLKLNKAENHNDYLNALKTFYCPGQNFIFASVKGDIAIKQQGLFPNTPIDQDKFILNGSSSNLKMNHFIPIEDNPHCYNPSQGFLYSANQHPTDASYPYYYSSGDFESYRNRRIDNVLRQKEKLSIEDMKTLQSDNYSLLASEFVPIFLKYIDSNQTLYSKFKNWNYRFDESDEIATFFELWFKTFEKNVWDELLVEGVSLDYPKPIVLYDLLKNDTSFHFFDLISTSNKESAGDIVRMSFQEATKIYDTLSTKTWWQYKDTEIPHLTNIPALGRYHINTGGNKHIVNATWKNWAPSWRMIVELIKNRPVAYVNFPGGNSGNPSSKHYDDFIDSWAKYKYRKVVLSYKPSEINISNSIYFEK